MLFCFNHHFLSLPPTPPPHPRPRWLTGSGQALVWHIGLEGVKLFTVFRIVCSSALCSIMKVFWPSVVKLAVSKASISKQFWPAVNRTCQFSIALLTPPRNRAALVPGTHCIERWKGNCWGRGCLLFPSVCLAHWLGLIYP